MCRVRVLDANRRVQSLSRSLSLSFFLSLPHPSLLPLLSCSTDANFSAIVRTSAFNVSSPLPAVSFCFLQAKREYSCDNTSIT